VDVSQVDARTQVRQATNSLQNSLSRTTPGGKDKLDKEDFLKLMMAQMTNQNPLNPTDSQGMMNQLTSMGSLEQLINVNKQLGELGKTQGDLSRSNAYAFLDKDVTVKGGAARVTQGAASDLRFQMPREAETVRVNIVDGGGTTVRTLDLGGRGPGSHVVNWDGRDKDGDTVLDGTYHYSVTAKSADAQPVPVETFMTGKVSGVRFDNGRPFLKVNGEEIDAREIIELSNQSHRLFSAMQPLPLKESLQPAPPYLEPRRK
jgi:flagellar basal-body rod modification protein FlgD